MNESKLLPKHGNDVIHRAMEDRCTAAVPPGSARAPPSRWQRVLPTRRHASMRTSHGEGHSYEAIHILPPNEEIPQDAEEVSAYRHIILSTLAVRNRSEGRGGLRRGEVRWRSCLLIPPHWLPKRGDLASPEGDGFRVTAHPATHWPPGPRVGAEESRRRKRGRVSGVPPLHTGRRDRVRGEARPKLELGDEL